MKKYAVLSIQDLMDELYKFLVSYKEGSVKPEDVLQWVPGGDLLKKIRDYTESVKKLTDYVLENFDKFDEPSLTEELKYIYQHLEDIHGIFIPKLEDLGKRDPKVITEIFGEEVFDTLKRAPERLFKALGKYLSQLTEMSDKGKLKSVLEETLQITGYIVAKIDKYLGTKLETRPRAATAFFTDLYAEFREDPHLTDYILEILDKLYNSVPELQSTIHEVIPGLIRTHFYYRPDKAVTFHSWLDYYNKYSFLKEVEFPFELFKEVFEKEPDQVLLLLDDESFINFVKKSPKTYKIIEETLVDYLEKPVKRVERGITPEENLKLIREKIVKFLKKVYSLTEELTKGLTEEPTKSTKEFVKESAEELPGVSKKLYRLLGGPLELSQVVKQEPEEAYIDWGKLNLYKQLLDELDKVSTETKTKLDAYKDYFTDPEKVEEGVLSGELSIIDLENKMLEALKQHVSWYIAKELLITAAENSELVGKDIKDVKNEIESGQHDEKINGLASTIQGYLEVIVSVGREFQEKWSVRVGVLSVTIDSDKISETFNLDSIESFKSAVNRVAYLGADKLIDDKIVRNSVFNALSNIAGVRVKPKADLYKLEPGSEIVVSFDVLRDRISDITSRYDKYRSLYGTSFTLGALSDIIYETGITLDKISSIFDLSDRKKLESIKNWVQTNIKKGEGLGRLLVELLKLVDKLNTETSSETKRTILQSLSVENIAQIKGDASKLVEDIDTCIDKLNKLYEATANEMEQLGPKIISDVTKIYNDFHELDAEIHEALNILVHVVQGISNKDIIDQANTLLDKYHDIRRDITDVVKYIKLVIDTGQLNPEIVQRLLDSLSQIKVFPEEVGKLIGPMKSMSIDLGSFVQNLEEMTGNLAEKAKRIEDETEAYEEIVQESLERPEEEVSDVVFKGEEYEKYLKELE